MKQPSSQSGNVIMIILIGMVFFAALSYAVTSSMRGGSDFGANEKVSMQLNEFLAFGNTLEVTVRALLANGCKDTEISFENPVVSGYTNSSSPSDKRCHVFDPAGGGLTYTKPSAGLLAPAWSAETDYGQWLITGRWCYLDVGSGGSSCTAANSELSLILKYTTKNMCDIITSTFSQSGRIHNGGGIPQFTGWYGTNLLGTATGSGKRNFCYTYSDYRIVYTILAR